MLILKSDLPNVHVAINERGFAQSSLGQCPYILMLLGLSLTNR